MPFKMSFAQDKLEGQQPVAPGIYKVLFIGFKPALSREANKVTGVKSVNLNAQVKILDHPEWETDRMLFASLNEGIPGWIQDFVHSFGIEMEDQLGDSPSIPGTFGAGPNCIESDPTTWVYAGPLEGKIGEWEIGVGEYNGKPKQTIRRFVCSVPDCATRFPKIRHASDMAKKG